MKMWTSPPSRPGVLLVRKSLTADLLTVIPNYVLVFILLPWRWGMEGRNLNENESVMLWQYSATLSELVRISSCYFKILLIIQKPFQTINVAIKAITSWAIRSWNAILKYETIFRRSWNKVSQTAFWSFIVLDVTKSLTVVLNSLLKKMPCRKGQRKMSFFKRISLVMKSFSW